MTNKFKVGDKVRFVGNYNTHFHTNLLREHKDDLVVTRVDGRHISAKYLDGTNTAYVWVFYEDELAPLKERKFKIGDQVRIKDLNGICDNGFHVGDVITIKYIDGYNYPYGTDSDTGRRGWFSTSQLEKLTEFKLQVGDKVYYKYKSTSGIYDLVVEGLAGNTIEHFERINNATVLKVERTTVVYEAKEPEILDSAEKRYLKDVIRPFKHKVKYIIKRQPSSHDEYISIWLDNSETIPLPNFSTGLMYKEMVVDKEYSLKELGL